MFVIAFLIAFFLISEQMKKKGYYAWHFYNLSLIALIGLIIGPRLFYVLEHFSFFYKNPLQIFSIWQGGLTSYGAFLSIFFMWIYCKKKKLDFSELLDLMAPYIAIAAAIARIGCFFNWDDYGIQSTLPWAIQVSGDIARHPTQLYESIYMLAIFFILLKFKSIKEKGKSTRFKKLLEKPGALFLFFLLFYSFFRFFNDFLREYEINFLSLALSQWICLALFIISISILARKIIENHKRTPEPIKRQCPL